MDREILRPMTSRETCLMRVSRELMGIWRSQGRQGNGTPRGLETRNVTIDLQCELSFPVRNTHSKKRILATNTDLASNRCPMPQQEWIKTLADGRKVKFTYQELLVVGAFITAQIAGNEVVYSVVLTKAKNPLSREDVESHFEGELAKK
jgi:hypothetical protein